MALLGAISVVGSLIGAVSLIEQNLGFVSNNLQSLVHLTAGQSAQKGADLDGNYPAINLYSEDGDTLGQLAGNAKSVIALGAQWDGVIQQGMDQQATYVVVDHGGNNALCIANLQQVWTDGKRIAWDPEVAIACGNYWHYSDYIAGNINGTVYKPRCTWIDGDDSNGIDTLGFQIHTPDFLVDDGSTASTLYPDLSDVQQLCQPFRFQTFKYSKSHPVIILPTFENNTNDSPAVAARDVTASIAPRDTPPAQGPAFSSSLIVSHDTGHSAKALCEDYMSRGPDLVCIPEGLYCDMHTRIVWPVCEDPATEGCFDVDTSTLRVAKTKRSIGGRQVYSDSGKAFTDVQVWGQSA